MIIKSMTRKDNSFAQLVEYIGRHDNDDDRDIYHNFYQFKRASVIDEFEENAAHLPKRRNGNVMYHEVISISRSPNIAIEQQKIYLQDIVEEYIRKRAPDCLAFGSIHDEKDNNLHYHVMISANAIGERKRHSIRKNQFNKLVREHEIWMNQKYPELEQGKIIGTPARERVTNKAGELIRRGGKLSRRQDLKRRLSQVFEATNWLDAADRLSSNNLEFYKWGKNYGVIDGNFDSKHRFKTIGVTEDFENFKANMELAELQAKETPIIEIPTKKERKHQPEATEKTQEREIETEATRVPQKTVEPIQEPIVEEMDDFERERLARELELKKLAAERDGRELDKDLDK